MYVSLRSAHSIHAVHLKHLPVFQSNRRQLPSPTVFHILGYHYRKRASSVTCGALAAQTSLAQTVQAIGPPLLAVFGKDV
jgi:hypothetical protein